MSWSTNKNASSFDAAMIDHYAVLHVLPVADASVIRAAYRALIKRFHPDNRTSGESGDEDAARQLNEAYRVLSDPLLRESYDAERERMGRNGALDEAVAPPPPFMENDWEVASKHFPMLAQIDRDVSQISDSLAFHFRATVLTEKSFQNAQAIADRLVQDYLTAYFGQNSQVREFARFLIENQARLAAKSLNKAVKVLGGEVGIERLRDALFSEFPNLHSRLEFARLLLRIIGGNASRADCKTLLSFKGIQFKEGGFWNETWSIVFENKVNDVHPDRLGEWLLYEGIPQQALTYLRANMERPKW